MALESKGFGYSGVRTNYLELRMRGKDYLMVCIGVLIVASAVILKTSPTAYAELVNIFPWADFA
jgi:energy-coupling factor transporter transmembrane protein EcfT